MSLGLNFARFNALPMSVHRLALGSEPLRSYRWRLHCRITPHGLPRCTIHRTVPDGQFAIHSSSRIHMSSRRFAHREKSRLSSSYVVSLTDAEIFLPQRPPQESHFRLHARSPMKLASGTARKKSHQAFESRAGDCFFLWGFTSIKGKRVTQVSVKQ